MPQSLHAFVDHWCQHLKPLIQSTVDTMQSLQARPAHGAVHSSARRVHVQRVRVTCNAVATNRFIPKWPDCYGNLREKGLKTISPEEASELLASGNWVLLDVRRPDQHEGAHPEGAVCVPMYRLIDMSKPDPAKLLKMVAYSFNGVQAVESNFDFVKEALAAAGGKNILTICEAGGTMNPTVNFPQGKASRSLQAAWKLMQEGGLSADQVMHVERGLYGWYQADLPINGEYTPDVGRTPMAAPEPTLQQVAQSVGYEMKEGDKPLEPKKNWWGF